MHKVLAIAHCNHSTTAMILVKVRALAHAGPEREQVTKASSYSLSPSWKRVGFSVNRMRVTELAAYSNTTSNTW